eukprot:TRINITY_DN35403_c0_g1_i1.p1 TRINITY_DN35403_c0_g1~~TRINITY_DN35403_c0_g1_i1.p1  ORF type:complete len:471 (-),score=51.56 TRINITY_DN35403_c0_g1_i1:131-1543(-)
MGEPPPLVRQQTYFSDCYSRQGSGELNPPHDLELREQRLDVEVKVREGLEVLSRPRDLALLEQRLEANGGPDMNLESLLAVRERYSADFDLAAERLSLKELREELQVSLGELEDLLTDDDLTSKAIVLPGQLRCRQEDWSLQVQLSPEHIFKVLHLYALTSCCIGILWSGAAVTMGYLPTGIVWFICPVLKLGYPMIPVIIGCWIKRRRTTPGMTPGYYFANLKMPLMASLGPGLLIGALGDTVVLHLCGITQVIGRTYSAFILAFAWLTTCLVFWLLENCIYRTFGTQNGRAETDNKDWGFYSRVLVERECTGERWYYSEKFQVYLRPGISWTLGFIPTPRNGTFHKITDANKLRCISITVICGLIWCMLIVAGHSRFIPDIEVNSVPYLLIHTDMHNFIINALTAPFLIQTTWRAEPSAGERRAEPQRDQRPWVLLAPIEEELKTILDDIKKIKDEVEQSNHGTASSA